MSYCEYVASGKAHPLHVAYHDTEYGFRIESDNELFERLVLEINQAGLSWEIVLKKREGMRAAYDGFDVDKVSNYGPEDIERLLSNPDIIRNRLKVLAAITNAGVIAGFRGTHGSFSQWLDSHHPATREEWTKLFKKTFRFTGGEIVNEFLMSTGYLPGAHDSDCTIGLALLHS